MEEKKRPSIRCISKYQIVYIFFIGWLKIKYCNNIFIFYQLDRVPFYKKAAFHEATQYLENGGKFLVLSGIWGSGKTETAKQVYKSATEKLPAIITHLEKFNYQNQNQALISDKAILEDISDRKKKKLQNIIYRI